MDEKKGRPYMPFKRKPTSFSLSEEAARQLIELADGRSKSFTVEVLINRAWERRQRRRQLKQIVTENVSGELVQDPEPENESQSQY